MNTRIISDSLKFLALVLFFSTALPAAVEEAVMGKEQINYQEGPTLDDFGDSEFRFTVEVGAENQADASNVSFRREGGAAVPVLWDPQDGGYWFSQEFATQAELNAAYPAGDYFLTFTPSGGSQVSRALPITDEIPNLPVIENWFDLQHFPVGEEVTVRWGAMVGGSANDVINFEILDHSQADARVFESGVHLFGDPEPISPDGTDTSITIPANTLEADGDYSFILGFNKIDLLDDGQTLADVLIAAIPYAETSGRLKPVTRHPSTVINWGLVSRRTTHNQIGPDTLEPVADEDQAHLYAYVWLDDPDALVSAALSGRPLDKSPAGDGWGLSEAASSGTELYASRFPNADYALEYSFAAGGSHGTTLTFSGGELPGVRLANWSSLQATDAGSVTTVRWMAPESIRAGDAYQVQVRDAEGELVFETDFDLVDGTGLGAADTSVDIPAGTLTTGRLYQGSVSWIRVTDLDRNSQASAAFVAANAVETRFTINTGAAGNDPVQIGAIGREVYYLQTGPGAPVLDLQDDEQFGALAVLLGESVHELASASVTIPGGTVFPLEYDGDGSEFGAFQTHASFDALVANFPAGDYTLRYQITGGAQVEKTVTGGEVFPGAPHVTNWAATQSVDASQDFTITWDPIDGMTETDGIAVYVDDPMGGGDLFARDVYLIDPSGLRGTAQSVTIPAGILEPGQTYEVTLDALKFTEIDQSNDNQVFVAFNMRSTGFNLVTSSGNQAPSISTDLLDEALEGQSYVFDVTASDPEDGSSVALRAPVLPSWLTFVDMGTGTGRLTGSPSLANVGTFTVTIEATDSQGLTGLGTFTLVVHPDLSDPEGRALDIDSINWLRDQAAPFEAQIATVQHGESALISGAVGDGGTSFLQGTFVGPIKLSFYWKVSSQGDSDFFRVKVDDTTVAEISGEQNWRQQIIALPEGSHSVVWAYEKDGSGSGGADRGWLDHVTILPADAGVFAGTYLGGIASSTGEVSLYVRPNNKAVFLGYHPESGNGLSNFSFDVSETGTFSFEVVNPDDLGTPFMVAGSISDGVASGTVSGLNLSFTADLVSGGGQLVSYDGYYQNALTATANGLVYLIVATDGQAYFFAKDGGYVEGFITTIDAAGTIDLQTNQGIEYDLTVDKSTDIVTGSYTPPGGEPSSILGIREGSPGDELLANISTRGQVLSGDKVMIASFVITGTGSKQLLIRAIGPRLGDFGVGGILPDPSIDLIRLGQSEPMSSNNNWDEGAQTALVVAESARLGAFGLNPGGLDSVLLLALEPGAYTATVRGNGGMTGVGLVEVYDADNPDERLPTADVVNIATRGEVGTDADVLIAGFVVAGDVPKQVLIRGIGPQLGVFGVTGVLEDPRIDLIDSNNNVVASNNDWGDNTDVAAVVGATTEVGAFALEEGGKDAVLLIWLEPGAYTAQVSGADGGTGVALIEVYDY